ncbi:MAG: hypothetical protein IPK26_05150 [Planctomycetes bacterium]|nr:hypothetical protein [Planctomycetota bacterium]
MAIACSRPPNDPSAPFSVHRSTPEFGGAVPVVMLNDWLTLYFNAPIDPMTVTRDTLTVLDAEGHQVQGQLRVDAQYVAFVPEPPITAELTDGSLQPGREYRLVAAGYPRPDAIRSRTGQRLDRMFVGVFRTAGHDALPPLRPIQGRPTMLVTARHGQLPVDRPFVQLHFTAPVLPTTVRPAAFEVLVSRDSRWWGVRPRGARVTPVRGPGDEYPGCTVELDLGGELAVLDGEDTEVLQAGDFLQVGLVHGRDALLGYGNQMVLQPPDTTMWTVVDGASVTVLEWPGALGERALDSESLLPGFEVVQGGVRARTRVEAGNGMLGILRPRHDLVLRPGEPFDRGDGTLVQSEGNRFPFLAIDIPAGITVRLLAPNGAALLACGSVRIDGELQIDTPPLVARGHALREVPVAALLTGAAVALVAGGEVIVNGAVTAAGAIGEGQSVLTVASAGGARITGPLPDGAIVAVEAQRPLQWHAAQRKRTMTTRLTPGVPENCEIECVAHSAWLRFPSDVASGIVAIDQLDPRLEIGWQLAPPDPVRTGRADTRPERLTQIRDVAPGGAIDVPAGHHLRFRLRTRVQPGTSPPRLASIAVRAR